MSQIKERFNNFKGQISSAMMSTEVFCYTPEEIDAMGIPEIPEGYDGSDIEPETCVHTSLDLLYEIICGNPETFKCIDKICFMVEDALYAAYHDITLEPPVDPRNNNFHFNMISAYGVANELTKRYLYETEDLIDNDSAHQLYLASAAVYTLVGIASSGQFMNHYIPIINRIVKIIEDAQNTYFTQYKDQYPAIYATISEINNDSGLNNNSLEGGIALLTDESETQPATKEIEILSKEENAIYHFYNENDISIRNQIDSVWKEFQADLIKIFGNTFELKDTRYNWNVSGYINWIYRMVDTFNEFTQYNNQVLQYYTSTHKNMGDVWDRASTYMADYSTVAADAYSTYQKAQNEIDRLYEKYPYNLEPGQLAEMTSPHELTILTQISDAMQPTWPPRQKWSRQEIGMAETQIVTSTAYDTYLSAGDSFWNLTRKINEGIEEEIETLKKYEKS